MRRNKKIDASQPEIVKALRAIHGVSVELDKDDILCGYRGRNYWFEIKSADAISKKTGKVLESAKKDSQKRLDETWTGQRAYVSTPEEAVKIVMSRNRIVPTPPRYDDAYWAFVDDLDKNG
jgi:hypothetical protein